ncbi:MAG: vitamin K epoxide reductase family protein [Acidimicrobiales bacterium]
MSRAVGGLRAGDSPERRGWRPLAVGGICLAGIGLSIYLLIVHYDRGALVCSNTGVVNCTKVLTSPQSAIFRIPVSALGLAYFIGMAVICIPGAWCSAAAWLAWGRIAAATVGIAMVVYLIAQEALVLHVICLWCTGVHVLTFAMFLIIITGWEDTGYARSRYEY